jgi:hypothetical protein
MTQLTEHSSSHELSKLLDESTKQLAESAKRNSDLVYQLAERDAEADALKEELARTQALLIRAQAQASPAGVVDAQWSSAKPNSSAAMVVDLPLVDDSYRQQLQRIHNSLSGRSEAASSEAGGVGDRFGSAEDAGAWADEAGGPVRRLELHGATLEPLVRASAPALMIGPLRTRWSAARERLVEIACSQRETLALQTTFYAWVGLLRRQLRESHMSGERKLRLLTTLEEQRQRTLRALHASHLENRWHRQYLGGLLRHKMLLLLWCGRTLRRCWLAWGAHLVRVRMEREVVAELHQLACNTTTATTTTARARLRTHVPPPRRRVAASPPAQ